MLRIYIGSATAQNSAVQATNVAPEQLPRVKLSFAGGHDWLGATLLGRLGSLIDGGFLLFPNRVFLCQRDGVLPPVFGPWGLFCRTWGGGNRENGFFPFT